MPTTIELFGIVAEVPEGHPDFWANGGSIQFRIIDQDEFGLDKFSLWDIKGIFAESDDFNLYRQRRVVEAARIYWIDKAIEQLRSHIDSWPGEEQVIGNIDAKKRHIDYWQQAENWRRIGEKAKEAASG